ncbi:recombinase family protein [Bacillus sp. DTU_2020_1000418_1_SI_GHA_SEK_038]|uniref:recombinase family protein n=1 Tax=Bacillus sp. DTU_2020_1000418_1_SI_GHA_SEK_038 TaxID=3077585 RepID=UPI0028E387F3|nr:recombinase family protein [Bacillus sp. DTU_2020_1000418_1_SI_GHA_SEK_038]WNS74283.1 recombinase family protein [Bacillus sp. DTU_2020_1000418_1_SI_GHA_SEK_038]
MKVAAYIRVSTHMQVEDGYSLSAQKERLKAFAFSQGWEIVQYYVDEGISAKDMERPELQRMLKGVREGLFDIVLVYKLDRLTRSVIDLDKLLKEFANHNVMFKSSTEVYDTTTATGRLFIRLVASMAQWERENLGERVRMGMLQKAEEGKWVLNMAPFGYDRDGTDSLKINTAESLVVKEIYSLYSKGLGMHKIARKLNEKGVYTKKNKPWSQVTINYVLTNPTYKGTMRYNYRMNSEQYFEVEDAVPAIISENDFELVQKIIKSRQEFHPRQATSKHIFSKVLKCARCGKTLIGKSSQTKRGDKKYYSYNYYCPTRQRGLCDLPLINQNHLEKKFLQLFDNLNIEDVARGVREQKSKESEVDHQAIIKDYQKELEEIEERRKQWQYAWVKKMIKDTDFTKRMKEEEEKEKMILKELEKLTPQESSTPIDNIIESWSNVKLNWENLTVEEKKQFVAIGIDRIVIDRINMNKSPDAYVFKDVIFI